MRWDGRCGGWVKIVRRWGRFWGVDFGGLRFVLVVVKNVILVGKFVIVKYGINWDRRF